MGQPPDTLPFTARARSGARGRPAEVLSLAALFAGAAVCLAIAVAFPFSDQAPVRLGVVMLIVAVAMSAGTLLFGHRLPRWVLLAEVLVAIALNSVIVAFSHTKAGTMADSFAYLWLTAYAAFFFPAAGLATGIFAGAGLGIALLASGLDNMIAAWALISVTTVMTGVVTSHVSRLVRRDIGTDELTGVLNRVGLWEAAARAAGRRRRHADRITIAVLDLDGFKRVNDERGHAGGDRLLTDVTSAWREALREDDVLARVGGDEFVVMMPRTSPDEAAAVLRRLQEAHDVAWSAGVAQWDPAESLDACIERADKGLYAAKAGGRGDTARG